MATEDDIKEILLKLYNSREKFSALVNDERKKSIELESAFYLVEQIYTEKINLLQRVLTNSL